MVETTGPLVGRMMPPYPSLVAERFHVKWQEMEPIQIPYSEEAKT